MRKIKINRLAILLIFLAVFGISGPVVWGQEPTQFNAESEKALEESISLPAIHENTKIYNGKSAVGTTVYYQISDREETRTAVPVNETGKFAIDFGTINFTIGETIRFYILDESTDWTTELEQSILPAATGSEIMGMNQTPSEEETALQEASSLPALYPYTKEYTGRTVPGSTIRLLIDGVLSESFVKSVSSSGEFQWSFIDETLQIGQSIQFVIVSKGTTSILDQIVSEPTEEWKAASDKIKKETILPDIYSTTTSYTGKTISNALIAVENRQSPEDFILEVRSDEKGNFSADFSSLGKLTENDTILFTITDVKGSYASFEQFVLLEEPAELEKTEPANEPEIVSENEPIIDSSKIEKKADLEVGSSSVIDKPLRAKAATELMSNQIEESTPKAPVKESDGDNEMLESDKLGTVFSSQSSIEEQIEQTDPETDNESVDKGSSIFSSLTLPILVLLGAISMGGFLYKH